eukprot:TRINITY_DN1282_c0_g1_i3.p1 TRINITY_DN1282_c0_g1~~TRINITY_DN1282_c0_g1_i3.p1  ORF type:complete len:207 (-),score=50.42 TRINITY_DN1282_c0_g1_i3:179-775(-)
MIRRPPRSTHCISSAASDVYKRQVHEDRQDDHGRGQGHQRPRRALPVFGICLGFEAMIAAEADDVTVVEKKHEGLGYGARLIYALKRDDSRFLSAFPTHILDYVERVDATHNYHEYMTSPEKFAANANLTKTYKIVSLSNSMKGSFSFVSIIEGISYPFYAVQFHPELGMASYYRPYLYFPNENLAAEFGRGMLKLML